MLATLFSLSTEASGTLEVRHISGCVSSQGRGLAGVAVTDGSNIVVTDSMG